MRVPFSPHPRNYQFFFFLNKIFILSIWQYPVLVAAHRTLDLSCGMWDLVPWLGIEPGPPALGAQSPSHWTTREVLYFLSFWWQLFLHMWTDPIVLICISLMISHVEYLARDFYRAEWAGTRKWYWAFADGLSKGGCCSVTTFLVRNKGKSCSGQKTGAEQTSPDGWMRLSFSGRVEHRA